MHIDIKRLLSLQYFADGAPAGDGGDGGATGEGAANPGQQGLTLEEMGVPKALAERHRARLAKRTERDSKTETGVEEPVKKPESEPASAVITKPTLEDVLKDPSENAKMQTIIKDRLKKANSELETRRKLDSVLSAVAKKAGIKDFDINNIDANTLISAVERDSSYFEGEAMTKGITAEEAMNAHKQARETKERESVQLRAHFNTLQQQAAEMQNEVPGFDLSKELENPRFFNLTSMNNGVSVKDAYFAVHANEIKEQLEQAAVQKALNSVSNSIRSGAQIPTENGAGNRSTGTIQTKLYKDMNEEERRAFYRRVTGREMSRR